MKSISADTKIASLIKQHPGALEAIVSLSPKFAKLRNPILRKVIAARTSISMASKIGGCSVDDFFSKLQPLGFTIENASVKPERNMKNKPVPEYIKKLSADKIIELDVRSVIESGKDPLDIIVQKIKTLETGSLLKIINSFIPTPLMHLLGRQGFESYAEVVSDELVNTYFYKSPDKTPFFGNKEIGDSASWDEIVERFKGRFEILDVRKLEMPLPMHMILESLQTLSQHKALFVYHKRIPVFLLPELEEQKFSYRIKEVSDGEVNMLIYKN